MKDDSPYLILQKTQTGLGCVRVDELKISAGQSWGIVGRNGGGKTSLAMMLAEGEHLSATQRVNRFKQIGLVSFEREDELLEREIREDDTDFLDRIDPGRTTRELIEEVCPEGTESIDRLVSDLALTEFLDRGLRLLSTGERRRLMLARALVQPPDLLVLDEPFDGLDQEFRVHLAGLLKEMARDVTLVIVANRLSDLNGFVSHLACVDAGECVLAGERSEVEGNVAFSQLMELSDEVVPLPAKDESSVIERWDGSVVIMKKVTVTHGGRDILATFDWQVEKGQNWKISGPNGCGKSTLVNLVTGDHPQCYSNDVTVMGMRRGSGESIWEVKNYIGIVSTALHQQYRVGATALAVVVSGFFDSVGVYREASAHHIQIAREWLELVGMSSWANHPFRSLSFGQQRLLLIARALVKQPPLLILDEPCQGLDPINRALVLRVIDRIVSTGFTQLLYITHEPEDRLECITHELVHDGSGWKKTNLGSKN